MKAILTLRLIDGDIDTETDLMEMSMNVGRDAFETALTRHVAHNMHNSIGQAFEQYDQAVEDAKEAAVEQAAEEEPAEEEDAESDET